MTAKLSATIVFLIVLNGFSQAQQPPTTPGNAHHGQHIQKSPFSLAELKELQQSMLFNDEDLRYLRMSHDILKPQTSQILDVWYGFVGGTPQLAYFFSDKTTGKPDPVYLAKVRKRFETWILQTAEAKFDQAWLDYQYEIGLRHYSTKKNKTDSVNSVPIINYRYIPALTIPVTTTLKPFLAKTGAGAAEVEGMYNAWVKIVLLQSILWGQPYMKTGEF